MAYQDKFKEQLCNDEDVVDWKINEHHLVNSSVQFPDIRQDKLRTEDSHDMLAVNETSRGLFSDSSCYNCPINTTSFISDSFNTEESKYKPVVKEMVCPGFDQSVLRNYGRSALQLSDFNLIGEIPKAETPIFYQSYKDFTSHGSQTCNADDDSNKSAANEVARFSYSDFPAVTWDKENSGLSDVARPIFLNSFKELLPTSLRDLEMNEIRGGRAITGIGQHLNTMSGRSDAEFPDCKELTQNGAQRAITGFSKHPIKLNWKSDAEFPNIGELPHHGAHRRAICFSTHPSTFNGRSHGKFPVIKEWRHPGAQRVNQHLSTLNGRSDAEFPDIKELTNPGAQRAIIGIGQHLSKMNGKSDADFTFIKELNHHGAPRVITGYSQHIYMNNVRPVATFPDMTPYKESSDDDAQIKGQEYLCNLMNGFQTTKKSKFYFANSDIPSSDISSIYESIVHNFDIDNGNCGFFRSLN